MLTSDAIYAELQALDYLTEFTPAQQKRYDYLENALFGVLTDEREAKKLLTQGA